MKSQKLLACYFLFVVDDKSSRALVPVKKVGSIFGTVRAGSMQTDHIPRPLLKVIFIIL